MQEDVLFEMPENVPSGSEKAASLAPARLQRPVRNQVEFFETDLESLVAQEHQARIVWAFVECQDLSGFYEKILARADRPGRTPADPAILLSLWLLAALEGVGAARALERRCQYDPAYRWLCGGVRVNYHTLADFRTAHGAVLDDLLVNSISSLLDADLVQMQRIAQDGMRVRASAGASSYRREKTLRRLHEEAREQVERLKEEVEADPGALSRREQAARERAAAERLKRLDQALETLERLDEADHRKPPSARKGREKLRVSTTDAQIFPVKMPDGGYRPAANVQLATDTQTQLIAGVDITAQGNDRGLMLTMAQQFQQRYGRTPRQWLADGGYHKPKDIEALAQPPHNTEVYAPPFSTNSAIDPYQPQKKDTPAVAQWRTRMATDEAKEVYKERAATAECVNAILRNRGLRAFTVRGLQKMKSVLLLFALAHNLKRLHDLNLHPAPA